MNVEIEEKGRGKGGERGREGGKEEKEREGGGAEDFVTVKKNMKNKTTFIFKTMQTGRVTQLAREDKTNSDKQQQNKKRGQGSETEN